MSKPEAMINELCDLVLTEGFDFRVKVTGRKRLNAELNQQGADLYKKIMEKAGAAYAEHMDRLEGNVRPEPESQPEPYVFNEPFPSEPPIEIPNSNRSLSVVEFGKAFSGDEAKTVIVYVTTKPYLHNSARGSWSWRCKVLGHDDFRHINVTNFHSSLTDGQGNYYVRVDAEWKTNQPIFKDVCNQG